MNCARCQTSLSCSVNQSCWCKALPAVLPAIEGAGCLCQPCLIKAIRTYIEQLSTRPIKEQLTIAKPYKNTSQFIEGLDFDMEQGLMVMTRWAHLKRGSCCGTGCKHCPYTQVIPIALNN